MDATFQGSPSLFERVTGFMMRGALFLAIFLTPLWFLPLTLDVLELNKQTLLIACVLVALSAWFLRGLFAKRFFVVFSWVQAVLLALLAALGLSSFFSLHPYLSFVGGAGQMSWAFVSVVASILFYLLFVQATQESKVFMDRAVGALLTSSALAAFFGFLQMVGVYVFRGFAANHNFTSLGTPNSLAVFLVVPALLALGRLVFGGAERLLPFEKQPLLGKILAWKTVILSLIVFVCVDFWVPWVVFGLGALTIGLLGAWRFHSPTSKKVFLPYVSCALSVVFLLWHLPINLGLAAEVSPSLSHSWNIATQALSSAPFLGSGPGTWIYLYAAHRAPSVNMSSFWNARFDHAFSTALTALPTVGLLGMGLSLILLVLVTLQAVSVLRTETRDEVWGLWATIMVSWFGILLLILLYPFTLAHSFVFWLLLGFLAVASPRSTKMWDMVRAPRAMKGFLVVFAVGSIVSLSTLWLLGQRFAAEVTYAQAVSAFREGKDATTVRTTLERAITLNHWEDSYERNLSQAYILEATQAAKGPAGEDRARKVDALIKAGVEAALAATRLAPVNVDNWSNLASVYTSIAPFTKGADEFAIKNLEEALVHEPNNPIFLNEIGRLHVLRADAYATLLSSKEEKTRKDATANIKAELGIAEEFFQRAITAKPDYAAAHYHLGIVYEREGRLEDSIHKLEQVLMSNNKDVGLGFQLATLYYRHKDKDKALNLLEQIVALDPQYANAHWYLSVMYEERGRYDDAIAQVKKVQETNPNEAVVTERLDRLVKARNAEARPVVAPLPEPLPTPTPNP